MRPSLTSLGRRLPELTADLAQLADLLDLDAPDTIDRTRALVDKVVLAICTEEGVGIELDAGTPIEELLRQLVDKQVIPASIAAHVRAVSDKELTLVGDATRALVGFLEWRVGSKSRIKYVPSRRRSRALVIAALAGAIIIAGIAITIIAWPSAPPELASSELVRIAGATFEMGSRPDEIEAALVLCRDVEHRVDCKVEGEQLAQEQPRTVTIAPFELDRHEVTVAAYVAWLDREQPPSNNVANLPNVDYDAATQRYSFQPERATLPIVGVTWTNANAYCIAVHKRLPTEAEWELAARGPERRLFPWGNDRPSCGDVVYARREPRPCFQAGDWPEDAMPVMSAPKDVTPDTVRDLGGNVAEWTADAGGIRPRCSGSCENPKLDGPPGASRVVRGGDWSGWLGWARGARRSVASPETTRTNVGFRCAR